MIDIKRLLKRLPSYDDSQQTSTPTEAEQILKIIKSSIENQSYDFTSKNSIRIFVIDHQATLENRTFVLDALEVSWSIT